MPSAASYRSGERPRTGASGESQKEVSSGCRQLRNDNHTRLCSTPRPPARTPSSALLTPLRKGPGEPFPGASPRGNETAENESLLLLFLCVQGLKTLPSSPSKCKVKQLSKPPKARREPGTADPSSPPGQGRPPPAGEGRVKR